MRNYTDFPTADLTFQQFLSSTFVAFVPPYLLFLEILTLSSREDGV